MRISALLGVTISNTGQINQSSNDGLVNGNTSISSLFGTASNLLIYIVGAVSVIMIIVGGLKYVTSNGDPKHVESAKNTLLYAVIGLVVAIIAYAVVKFVVSRLA